MYREHNTLIASPSLLARSPFRTVEDIVNETWLTTDSRPRDWETWLNVANVPTLTPHRVLKFDHYFVTLQAVLDGLGVGIGPIPTLDADLLNGRLCQPFPHLTTPGATYHAVLPSDTETPEHVKTFVAWLHSAFTDQPLISMDVGGPTTSACNHGRNHAFD